MVWAVVFEPTLRGAAAGFVWGWCEPVPARSQGRLWPPRFARPPPGLAIWLGWVRCSEGARMWLG